MQSDLGAEGSDAGATSADLATAEELAARLRAAAAGASRGGSGDAAGDDDDDDAMLERVLEQLDGEPEMAGAIEQLVQQVMAKDVLYEPLVELRDSYPTWLARSGDALPEAERTRFTQQHVLIGRICAEYESAEIDYDRLTDLMADVQQLGSPPADIVKSLAPDVELDNEGRPKLDPAACTIQ